MGDLHRDCETLERLKDKHIDAFQGVMESVGGRIRGVRISVRASETQEAAWIMSAMSTNV
jgi:hypothetical protein